MTGLNLDQLFYLAQESRVLDECEDDLRKSNHSEIADQFLKLQQDVGVAIDRETNPDFHSVAPGSQSALLRKNFEEVTTERALNIIDKVTKNISAPSLLEALNKISSILSCDQIEKIRLEYQPVL